MAVVTYPDGRVFEIADGDQPLADYYRGEGATISGDLAGVEFPRVYDGGDTYVGEPEVEQAYDVDAGDAAQDAWVQAGTVPQIIEAVTARPEIAESVRAAETRRGDDARTTLLDALDKIDQPAT